MMLLRLMLALLMTLVLILPIVARPLTVRLFWTVTAVGAPNVADGPFTVRPAFKKAAPDVVRVLFTDVG